VIKLELLLGVVAFALWVYCLVDAIGSPAAAVRNLPKVAWVLLILFFPFVGSLAWLVAGRPERTPAARSPYEGARPDFPEYDRPGRAAAVDRRRTRSSSVRSGLGRRSSAGATRSSAGASASGTSSTGQPRAAR
jgi:Phospholipase_D-nuclease N-terminal